MTPSLLHPFIPSNSCLSYSFDMFFFKDVDMDLQNMFAFASGWGRRKDSFCTAHSEGPRASHMCNKWFSWNGNQFITIVIYVYI